MILVWILAGVTSVILDIITLHFFGIYTVIGSIFAILAMHAGYSIPAQTVIFLYFSVSVYILTFSFLDKLKRRIEEKAKKEELGNYVISVCFKNIIQ